MKYRRSFPFVLAAALASCTNADTPTGVSSLDVGDPRYETSRGVKPPPPLSSEDTDIDISSPVIDGLDLDPLDASTMADPDPDLGADGYFNGLGARGRYFAGPPELSHGWIHFETSPTVIASPNARLAYNEKTGKTTGIGTLTDADGTVLYLSRVEIILGQFGPCPDGPPDTYVPLCAEATFEYNGIEGGLLFVRPSSPFVPD